MSNYHEIYDVDAQRAMAFDLEDGELLGIWFAFSPVGSWKCVVVDEYTYTEEGGIRGYRNGVLIVDLPGDIQFYVINLAVMKPVSEGELAERAIDQFHQQMLIQRRVENLRGPQRAEEE